MKHIFALAAAPLAFAAFAAPAAAQEVDEARVNQVIVYGDDSCPQSSEDEIVICARLPDDDRFRIPDNLRGNPNDPANQSWVNRAVELSYVGRTGIGSCTPVGPGGMIGCNQQLIQQARAERAGSDQTNWARLIEEARQERLARIDDEAEAVEADVRAREEERQRQQPR